MNDIHTKIYPRKLLGVQILSLNYNNGHNILRLFPPQMKQSMIISCKLPQGLPNDLRLRISEN